MAEIKVLDEVCSSIACHGQIPGWAVEKLKRTFGKRFENAAEAVEAVAVKKYIFEPSGRVVWIVVGKGRDYQIIPEAHYCSCEDFFYNVVNGKASLCYHIIAQKIASALGKFELFRDPDETYEMLMREWRFIRKETVST